MKTSKQNTAAEEESELALDIDTGEEITIEETDASASSLAAKLKAMRDDLKKCQKERDENLAGWQRAKADLVNYRRTVEEDRARDNARARGKLMRALIPALDSFDTAMADPKWTEVDPGWRKGVERTVAQIHKALEAEGLVAFGVEGELFDPTQHECMSVLAAETEDEDHTIAQVLQKGYSVGDEVVRAAKVIVYQHG